MKEDELRDLFFAEAEENQEALNRCFIALEKEKSNKKAVEEIFRITHTLKANASGMGYHEIASLAHTMEDVFSAIKKGSILLNEAMFSDLFRANDILGALIRQAKDPASSVKVHFKGIKTKLEVLLRRETSSPPPAQEIEAPAELVLSGVAISESEYPAPSTVQPGPENDLIEINPTASASTLPIEDETPHPSDLQSAGIAFSDLVHIPVKKLDFLMNLVGELRIECDRLVTSLNSVNQGRKNEFARIQRITSDLQYSVMDIRLVPVNVLFNKFHRIVRDTAHLESKVVNLHMEGTDIEIDRNILQIISDSLVHLVRNAISHGIESKEERVRQGKSAEGMLKLSAQNDKDTVIISVEDDGKGIEADKIAKKALEKGVITAEALKFMSEDDKIGLIFEPGFSSADTITSVSGRGVGMDVVKRAVERIGGRVVVQTSPGQGSVISMYLPSSMALKPALLFENQSIEYAIPLAYTESVISILKKDLHVVGKGLVCNYLNKTIYVLFMSDFFVTSDLHMPAQPARNLQGGMSTLTDTSKINVIVVSYGNKHLGLVVDKLLQQKEIVEKSLSKPLHELTFFSGATILGNGHVCLVLDIPSLTKHVFKTFKNS